MSDTTTGSSYSLRVTGTLFNLAAEKSGFSCPLTVIHLIIRRSFVGTI